MNYYALLEWATIGVILFFQYKFYSSTKNKIEILNNILPDTNKLSISDSNNNQPYIDGGHNNNIIITINSYLQKNKGAVADFNLLRDITQRSIDSLEDEINMTIQTPVFLGLAGTMLGIIMGLFFLPDISSPEFLNGGVDKLLGGVKVAMVASLVGLILTIYNTSIKFRNIRANVESEKNKFFTFLQLELLPNLSESVTSGIIGLNRTVEKFGTVFNENVKKLESLINKNYDSLMAQQAGIDTLNKVDVANIAKFNVKVLGEITQSMEAIEKMAYVFKNIDSLVNNSKNIVEKTSDVLNLTEKIGETLNYTKELQLFLKSHFGELEHRSQLINGTVGNVDNIINESLKSLEAHIHERIQAVKDIKLQAEDLLKEEFDQNRNVLGKIKFLEPLSNDFKLYSNIDSQNSKDVAASIRALAEIMQSNNDDVKKIFDQISKNTLTSQITSIFKRKKNKETGK